MSNPPTVGEGPEALGARSAAEQIMANVQMDPNGGCWLWSGAMANDYGRFEADGVKRRAHRLSYEVFIGDPTGHFVCHKCDVRACVNPDHLFLGTHNENMADMVAKGRQKQWRGERQGGANPHSKLNAKKASAIRKSGESVKSLAQRYGVSIWAIYDIRSGRNWKNEQTSLDGETS